MNEHSQPVGYAIVTDNTRGLTTADARSPPNGLRGADTPRRHGVGQTRRSRIGEVVHTRTQGSEQQE
jgi:hypothetical protein